jgi:hypothetical protein
VNQESPTRLEPNNQILAAPVDGGDALALELAGDLIGIERSCQPPVEDLDALEAPTFEKRDELPAHALDLRKLRHASAASSDVSSRRTDARRPH